MDLANFPVGIIDWSKLPEAVHPGASGFATIRTHQLANIQIRQITYSANYMADHWCHKGHIVFVVEGQLVIEHLDGQTHTLTPDITYQVADNGGPPHRLRSDSGATVFVID